MQVSVILICVCEDNAQQKYSRADGFIHLISVVRVHRDEETDVIRHQRDIAVIHKVAELGQACVENKRAGSNQV